MYGTQSTVALRSYTSSVPSYGITKVGNQSSYSLRTTRAGTNSGLKIKDRNVYKQFFVTRKRWGVIGVREVVFYKKEVWATRTKTLHRKGLPVRYIKKVIYRRRRVAITVPVRGWIYYRVPKWIMIPLAGSTLYVPPNYMTLETVVIDNDNAVTSPITQNNIPMGQTIMNGIMRTETAVNMQIGIDVDAILNQGYPAEKWNILDLLTTVKMYDKLRSGIASLTTMAAESRKTTDMLANYGSRILDTLLNAKRQFSKEVARFGSREGVSSEYLKLIYGMVPFIKDVQSLQYQMNQETKVWRTYRAVEKDQWTTSGSLDINGNSIRYTVKHTLIVKKQLVIDGSQPFSSFRPPGIGTMLDTAWEVVPWSFVVDWFLPIGSYLASLDILTNVQRRSYHVSTLYTKELTMESNHHRSNPSSWRIGPGGRQAAYAKRVTFLRVIPQTIPAFPLHFSGKGLTGQRSLNAFFLALQQLGRK